MNGIDIIIVVSLIAGFFTGWKLKAINLLGFSLAMAAAIWGANHFSVQLVGLFKDMSEAARQTCAWATVFLFVLVTISLFFSLISRSFEMSNLKWLDHLLGAGLALAVTLSLLMIVLNLVNYWSPRHHSNLIHKSTLGAPLLRCSQPLIQNSLREFPKFKEAIR